MNPLNSTNTDQVRTPRRSDTSDENNLRSATTDLPIAGRHVPSLLFFSVSTLVVLFTDLLTKWLAFKHVTPRPIRLSKDTTDLGNAIPYHEPVELIPSILSIQLTTNTGAVFGLGKGAQWLFIVVSVFATAVVCRFFYTSRAGARMLHIALGLILAGALGNMYDRIRFNAVRDLLRLFPDTTIWPWIFNIADASLMLGVGLIILMVWRADHNVIRSKSQTDSSTIPVNTG